MTPKMILKFAGGKDGKVPSTVINKLLTLDEGMNTAFSKVQKKLLTNPPTESRNNQGTYIDIYNFNKALINAEQGTGLIHYQVLSKITVHPKDAKGNYLRDAQGDFITKKVPGIITFLNYNGYDKACGITPLKIWSRTNRRGKRINSPGQDFSSALTTAKRQALSMIFGINSKHQSTYGNGNFSSNNWNNRGSNYRYNNQNYRYNNQNRGNNNYYNQNRSNYRQNNGNYNNGRNTNYNNRTTQQTNYNRTNTRQTQNQNPNQSRNFNSAGASKTTNKASRLQNQNNTSNSSASRSTAKSKNTSSANQSVPTKNPISRTQSKHLMAKVQEVNKLNPHFSINRIVKMVQTKTQMQPGQKMPKSQYAGAVSMLNSLIRPKLHIKNMSNKGKSTKSKTTSKSKVAKKS